MLQVRFERATLHSSERTIGVTCRFNPGVRATWISCCSTSRPPLPNACYLAYIIICYLRPEYRPAELATTPLAYNSMPHQELFIPYKGPAGPLFILHDWHDETDERPRCCQVD